MHVYVIVHWFNGAFIFESFFKYLKSSHTTRFSLLFSYYYFFFVLLFVAWCFLWLNDCKKNYNCKQILKIIFQLLLIGVCFIFLFFAVFAIFSKKRIAILRHFVFFWNNKKMCFVVCFFCFDCHELNMRKKTKTKKQQKIICFEFKIMG